ncbi:hypothetical protein BIW11_04324 [Tropilaelaps mercedesae]|uniref:Uncharacterized protein n=1 Tax=Tropilaelaps mercedesae TaxID=418985 RepID=A0A1V9X7Z4_9ACAR|nr:hypothetical protein BIW11_04324 [Tropilaelaps mercedesae]
MYHRALPPRWRPRLCAASSPRGASGSARALSVVAAGALRYWAPMSSSGRWPVEPSTADAGETAGPRGSCIGNRGKT